MKIGLFFGSFNPIHLGHIEIAKFFLKKCHFDKILFVVSPHNPLKSKDELLPEDLRLELVKLSIKKYPEFYSEDIEFSLPKPSFTANTLSHLKIKYPNDELHIIMGSDTLESLKKWKKPNYILQFPIIVYSRTEDIKNPFPKIKTIKVYKCPLLPISATSIRNLLKDKRDISGLVSKNIISKLLAEFSS